MADLSKLAHILSVRNCYFQNACRSKLRISALNTIDHDQIHRATNDG